MSRLALAGWLGALCGAAWVPQAQAIWVGDSTPPYQARADLNLLLDVGAFIYLQVGSAGAVIDTIQFDLTGLVPASGLTATLPPFGVGSASPVAATGTGTLSVVVRSNAGPVTLSATNNGAGAGLSNGAGGFIPYDQIRAVSDNPGLPSPALTNAGSTPVSVAATGYSGRVTVQSANWTYSFANTVAPPAGRYTGQVTYTVAAP
ncbi:MAG TPA: hypothetical protein PK359_02505 [Burkholderiaceae bacterium]|jgi:hypothetical protein|nr:hypothetical protein [Burkholderiaceae bacterium]